MVPAGLSPGRAGEKEAAEPVSCCENAFKQTLWKQLVASAVALIPNIVIDWFGYLLHLACCFGQSNKLIKGQQFVFQFFADWCGFWGSHMLQ